MMLSLLHVKQKIVLINSDDPNFLWHLSKLNSHPESPVFAPFWDELQKYTDEFGAVDEYRRDVLNLPIATFLQHLKFMQGYSCSVIVLDIPKFLAIKPIFQPHKATSIYD